MSDSERRILDRLLSIDFEGAAALRLQVDHLTGVEPKCTCGCPSITPLIKREKAPHASGSRLLPAEIQELVRTNGHRTNGDLLPGRRWLPRQLGMRVLRRRGIRVAKCGGLRGPHARRRGPPSVRSAIEWRPGAAAERERSMDVLRTGWWRLQRVYVVGLARVVRCNGTEGVPGSPSSPPLPLLGESRQDQFTSGSFRVLASSSATWTSFRLECDDTRRR